MSVMVSDEGKCQFVDEDESRRGAGDKALPMSRGCATLFYHDRPLGDETHEVYVDTLDGLCELRLTEDEMGDVRAENDEWSRLWRVYELVLKKSAKELGPRRFHPLGRKTFDESDRAEWAQWIKNKVTLLVPTELDDNIDNINIIIVPMRYVRTNRGEGGALVAKSRLTIAGHTDPSIGLYRTDAPTTSHLAVLLTAAIAVSMDWSGYIIDVATAFLTGESLHRELYTRAPREGLPAVDSSPAMRPFGLLKILKGADGLTEAPRLWCLKARALLEGIGAQELEVARAVFIFREEGKVGIAGLVAIRRLYVDDGQLFGDPEGPRFPR